MEVLITAGGTSEYIDSVRKITNSSTGRLGTYIYQSFQKKDIKELHIHYVVSEDGLLPQLINQDNTTIYKIRDTKSLEACIRDISKDHTLDIAIHSMAVSDFYVNTVDMLDTIIEVVLDEIANSSFATNQSLENEKDELNVEVLKQRLKLRIQEHPRSSTKKLSSKEDLLLMLKTTPKIIEIIRKLNPTCKLVGFKLLNQVDEKELIGVASNLGKRYNCEFVVANDLGSIHGDQHVAFFVRDNQVLKNYSTKEAIGDGIADYFFTTNTNSVCITMS